MEEGLMQDHKLSSILKVVSFLYDDMRDQRKQKKENPYIYPWQLH